MCGIAGYTHKNRLVEPGVIRRVTACLTHRGPDQQGTWESADVSLGAVRLKIIDLEGGNQPIVSDDGGAVVAFNGEVYNHLELRRELEALGHKFHSRCDTEVVLHAFLEWDTVAFSRLRGMFAIAIWLEAERRLVLARDRVGIKPLYYHRHGPDISFGSELKAIFTLPDAPRNLNLKALDYYLSLNYVPCPYTLVDGILKLPPGHFLDWRNGDAEMEPYWRLEFHPNRQMKSGDAKAELENLLRSAVREQLVADVPLGIWASGGIDSSTVLHYAAEQASGRLKTFSISFQGRSFDESPYFRQVAQIYSTDHQEFDLNPETELESAIGELAYYSDEPSADAGALPLWFLSRMTRQQVTVALSGEGGDELFGGYLTYLADDAARWLRLVPSVLRKQVLAGLHRYWPVSDEKISFEYKLKRMIEGSLLPPDEAHWFWNGACSAAQKAELGVLANGRGLLPLVERLPQGSQEAGFLNRYLLLDQYYYLPDDILYKVDRVSMAHSLEVRPVLLDHRIVEFMARVPEHLKVHWGRKKVLLRELMRGKLPSSILNRKKAGLDVPAHDWFRGVLRPLLLDVLNREAVESTGIFRWEGVESLIRCHLERRANLGYQLWGLLTLFLWMKRWRIQGAPAESMGKVTSARILATN